MYIYISISTCHYCTVESDEYHNFRYFLDCHVRMESGTTTSSLATISTFTQSPHQQTRRSKEEEEEEKVHSRLWCYLCTGFRSVGMHGGTRCGTSLPRDTVLLPSICGDTTSGISEVRLERNSYDLEVVPASQRKGKGTLGKEWHSPLHVATNRLRRKLTRWGSWWRIWQGSSPQLDTTGASWPLPLL